MLPEKLVALCVRLFAISIVFFTLSASSPWLAFVASQEFATPSVVYLLMMASSFVVAGVLWTFPGIVAARLMPKPMKGEIKHDWSKDELYSCGFVLLGVYFLAKAISDVFYWLIYLFLFARGVIESHQHTVQETTDIIITVVEVMIALALIFGSRGLTKLVHRFRYGAEK